MRATLSMLQSSLRLTLFTRANCSLCDTAKATVAQVNKERGFDYDEVDIMHEGNRCWKDVYEFDVPVVR